MKKSNGSRHQQSAHFQSFPDIDIIDLEKEDADLSDALFDKDAAAHMEDSTGEEDLEPEEETPRKKGILALLNVHVLFFVALIGIAAIIVLRFQTWGVKVDLEEIFQDGPGSYDNTFDSILPLVDAEGKRVDTNTDSPVIVAFGNAPFADDRDSADNLCNMIAKEAGATVYNCSVSGSYLSTQSPHFDANFYPLDAYSFYWLVSLATGASIDHYFTEAQAALGDATPPEAQEVYNTLTTLDFNTVDTIVIMYDGSDYLIGRGIYSDENPTDIQQYTGSLEAGIELLQTVYPHIRIIVMSAPYLYAVDPEGNYVSSDMYTYGQDVFSSYVIREAYSCNVRSVSFVDNLYGTITEDNADKYLTDNIHINAAGRELLTERFVYALEYYDGSAAQAE